MHGSISGSVLANADIDFMGEAIDSGGDIGVKTSPHRAAIKKAEAELKQECGVREESRRLLEFLEKGGDPLEFTVANATLHSVQSTSLTDQHAIHLVNSEVKDSFALANSLHGDSVASSDRPGAPTVSEPNTADNLLLFDGENEPLERIRNARNSSKRNRTESARSSQAKPFQNAKETEDSTIFRPYTRRYRSKINRDFARSNSTDLAQNRSGQVTSLSTCRGSLDGKGYYPEMANQKDRHMPSMSCPSSATSNGDIISKNGVSSSLNPEVEDVLVVRETSADTESSQLKDEANVTFRKNSAVVDSGETDLAKEKAQVISASTELESRKAVTTAGQENTSTQLNGIVELKGENKLIRNNAATGTDGLVSSYANDTGVDNKMNLHGVDKADSSETSIQKNLRVEGLQNLNDGEMKDENKGIHVDENQTTLLKTDVQSKRNDNCYYETEREHKANLTVPGKDKKVSNVLPNTYGHQLCPAKSVASAATSSCIDNKNTSSGADIKVSKHQLDLDDGSILVDTLKEDSILEEAQVIQAKRKRMAELSFGRVSKEARMRSQWDFVLEEMTWLANDFAQERLWKMTSAVQICHRIAVTSQLRSEERIQHRKLKNLASTLANAVLQFWSSVVVPLEFEETSFVDDKGTTDMECSKDVACENHRKCSDFGIKKYAQRFLNYYNSAVPYVAAAPSTTDSLSDSGIMETFWDDQLTEESLFYPVPFGAMDAYRKSVESHLARCEKSGSSLHEVETSAKDVAGGYNVVAYDEDDGETYYLPGSFECTKSSNSKNKKRKNLMESYSARSCDLVADLTYGSYTGGSNQPKLMGKRPASNINVASVLTKRVRTGNASRQRIISPFGYTTCGSLLMPSKADASSGDTSSFQDEQSSLHGESVVQKGTEVEASENFDKQLPYDMAEMSGKPKKKKKKKAHLGSAYDQAWLHDSTVHGEQKVHLTKRSETNHFDMNGLYGLHRAKKHKIAKQLAANDFDSVGTIPSPAPSQMSNMPSPNRFIRLIGGRDRGRKIKGLKISSCQQGFGNPWSLFEDQALVVLVHDMGPNWELISDAMNITLKIKCIYRNPNECKERHKSLMDRGAGDGADSAEDSGTSQSYPSTLPGIPKGSARQLFQRLQGPMEEDTLKSHFEKICLVGKKFHYKRPQNDTGDPKQIVPVHNSQVMALSQVFPNNLNGSVLMPLDLCDVTTSGQDVLSLENQGLPLLNPGTSVLPPSGANPSISGSPGSILGNLSAAPSASVRDDRLQYNQILSGKTQQQQQQQRNLSTVGAVPGPDRAMGANGASRGLPLSRPGFQGMSTPTMPNSSGMLSSGNIHSGVDSSQGNSVLKSREAMQRMIRGGQGDGQALPGFSGLSSGLANQTTSPPVQAYPNHLAHKQLHMLGNSNHPHLQNPGYATAEHQQSFAISQRLMHQRYMQQQPLPQPQFPASGAIMPLVPPQPQVPPVPSSPQKSPQMPSLVSSPATPSAVSMVQQSPQKPQLPPHGLGRNTQQHQLQQQMEQSGRQQHQRQPSQGKQQNKHLKGMGRGNMMQQQNISVEPSKPLIPSQSSNLLQQQQPKAFPSTPSPLPGQFRLKHMNADNSIQTQVSSNTLSPSTPSVSSGVAPSNHQHSLQHPKHNNQVRPAAAQSILQHNYPGNSGLSRNLPNESTPHVPHTVSSTTEMANTNATKGASGQPSIDSANTGVALSSVATSPPNVSGPHLSDFSVTKAVGISCMGSAETDPVPAISQEIGQQHLPGGLPSHGLRAGTQRSQQQPSLLPSQLQTAGENASSRSSGTKVE